MAKYAIHVTDSAEIDLRHYMAWERKAIAQAIRLHLTYQPSVETNNRKRLRENPLAPWELRAGKYRLFYEVEESSRCVTVVAVGHKEHNVLFIRGKEVKL